MEEVFQEFDPTPIASGAIAQVYRARLRSAVNGVQDVAVKVRHPSVDEKITRDLVILNTLVTVVSSGALSVFCFFAITYIPLQGGIPSDVTLDQVTR
jgi:predicted unusual protein kinase regulating ubiquinone biosynthesis (AarF/ABC1/UbiB family)